MSRRRILIVESDVVVRLALESCLTGLGPVAVISRRSAFAARDTYHERLDFAFITAADAGPDTFTLARSLMARDVPFAFITSESADELPRVWSHYPRVTKPLRRASVYGAMQQAANDVLAA